MVGLYSMGIVLYGFDRYFGVAHRILKRGNQNILQRPFRLGLWPHVDVSIANVVSFVYSKSNVVKYRY